MAAPPAGRSRIYAIDAARAMAIFGMIAVNVGPRDSGGLVGTLYHAPLGRASLLFVILAGLGMSLLTRSARQPHQPLPWAMILWRAFLLLTSGLALQMLDHQVNVILPTYGALFLLALPLLRVSSRVLAWTGGVLLVAGPVFWILLQTGSGETYEFTAPTLTDRPGRILHEIFLSGPYPVIVWLVPFIFGMWLGRLDLKDPLVRRRMALWGLAASAAGFAVYRVLVAILGDPGPDVELDRLMSAVNHSQMPLWLISGCGSAVMVLGVFLLADNFVARRLRPLVAAGQLSLTVYVAHLVLLAAVIRPAPHNLAEGILITAALSGLTIIFARSWSKRFRTGPLEVLLRWPRGSSKK